MIVFIYALILIIFSFYSYSQIDLNLTLSANEFYQILQNKLIYLGYYNRLLSSSIYVILVISLFFFYLFFLKKTINQSINKSKIILLIVISIFVCVFAYPAFSHDIYNYMFDARIVTKYHANPYFHSALDYSSDTWTRFMHWTHRNYPYGPIWLLITTPLSYFGFNKFVLTLFLFKIFFVFFHVGNMFLIYRIMKIANSKHALSALVFYSLNPVVLVESIISPHNEVQMLFFLLLAIYAYLGKRNVLSFIYLILSSGIKFITLSVMPLFGYFLLSKNKSSFNISFWIFFFILFSVLGLSLIKEPYSWYFLTVIGLGSLIIDRQGVLGVMIGLSLGCLLRYVPYLYFGEYNISVSLWQNITFIAPLILLLIYKIVEMIFHNKLLSKQK